jgi:hypothetical protein
MTLRAKTYWTAEIADGALDQKFEGKDKSKDGKKPWPSRQPEMEFHCTKHDTNIDCNRSTCKAWHDDQYAYLHDKGGVLWSQAPQINGGLGRFREGQKPVDAKVAKSDRDFYKLIVKKKIQGGGNNARKAAETQGAPNKRKKK